MKTNWVLEKLLVIIISFSTHILFFSFKDKLIHALKYSFLFCIVSLYICLLQVLCDWRSSKFRRVVKNLSGPEPIEKDAIKRVTPLIKAKP